MNWIYWFIGLAWVADGFLCFVFPAFVRNLFIRAYREGRFWTAGGGPALAGALLAWASFRSAAPWVLRVLALLAFAAGAYLFRAIRTTSPRAIEAVISLPNRVFRIWGFVLTLLGPLLISLRPW